MWPWQCVSFFCAAWLCACRHNRKPRLSLRLFLPRFMKSLVCSWLTCCKGCSWSNAASVSVHLAIHLRQMKASTNGAHSPKLDSCIVSCLWSTCVPRECYYAHFLFTPVLTAVTPMVVIYGKTSFWKALLHEFNIGLDEYPCLSLVPGQKPETSSAVKCKNWKVDALLCLCDILV